MQRQCISVVDLGCGTGANLRALAPLLPDSQWWTLVDNDPELLLAAKRALTDWADDNDGDGEREDSLSLRSGRKTISVSFHQADITTKLEAVLDRDQPNGLELVTAAAFFDLASEAFIRRFAAAVAKHRAVFYSALTYNGIQRWTPRGPSDQKMTAAFCQHQMTDKGLGSAAGPAAPVHLAEAFVAHGYGVTEGNSPWKLAAGDRKLIAELAIGFAAAVRETRTVSDAEIDSWIARRLTGAEVGHTDTLAIPGSSASAMSMGVDGDE